MNPTPTASHRAQALVLAAGRGERMRPLTDHTPKPLLKVHGKSLLGWHLDALVMSGIGETVINTAWLGEQIPQRFGNQHQHMALHYSMEGRDFGGALETAGGVVRALPLLQDVFWLLAGDVYMPGFRFEPLALQSFAASKFLAHLWLVPNPVHNPHGDFGLGDDGLALNLGKGLSGERFTYSTIGLYRRSFFASPLCPIEPGNPRGERAALAPMLRQAMDHKMVSAELYTGAWTDVGTPARLAQLNQTADP